MDLFKIIMDDHKLRSYKLDEVAAHFLGTRKIHISYDDIPVMQRSPEGREKLGVYWVKDAWLPCKIAIKMAKVINAILMSQVETYWVTQKLPQICTVILSIRIGKVA